mmetsp:Transcript_11072/g.28925  ORF Transcript_11072/g.28925 Transcript_11072/m.28925 type:complete len:410 (-) Transcript_11072:132-1361(-)
MHRAVLRLLRLLGAELGLGLATGQLACVAEVAAPGRHPPDLDDDRARHSRQGRLQRPGRRRLPQLLGRAPARSGAHGPTRALPLAPGVELRHPAWQRGAAEGFSKALRLPHPSRRCPWAVPHARVFRHEPRARGGRSPRAQPRCRGRGGPDRRGGVADLAPDGGCAYQPLPASRVRRQFERFGTHTREVAARGGNRRRVRSRGGGPGRRRFGAAARVGKAHPGRSTRIPSFDLVQQSGRDVCTGHNRHSLHRPDGAEVFANARDARECDGATVLSSAAAGVQLVSNYIAVEIAIEQIDGCPPTISGVDHRAEPCDAGTRTSGKPITPLRPWPRMSEVSPPRPFDVVGEFSFRLAQPSFLGTDGGLRRVPLRNFLGLHVRFGLNGQCRTQRFADLIERLSSGFQDCSSCR